jgi:serine phosphatase RsbU (regulator of sigma subunit)
VNACAAAMIRSALVMALLGCAAAVRGQEPAPAELRQALFAEGASVDLTLPWRFHGGDDPLWAAPGWDDSDWGIVDPLLPPAELPAGGWTGVGWFRRHLRLGPDLAGTSLTLRVEAPGAARVFLDGEPVLISEGAPGAAVAGAAGAAPGHGAFGAFTFPSPGEHLLAVRYEVSPRQPSDSAPPSLGFRLSLALPGAADALLAAERRRVAIEAIFVTIPAFLALLHLALFWSYPKARENLFYAASMASFVGITLCDLQLNRVASDVLEDLALRASTTFIFGAIFFVLLTYLSLRTAPLPRSWIGFAAAGAALAAWSWVDASSLARSWAWYLYFAAMLVEIVRVEARAPKVKREGISILLGGLVILGAVILLQILINQGIVPPLAGIGGVYVFGMLAFAIAMSLFLAGTFARTSTHLERRLVEVRSLSEQVLAQEREAHEQELSRRLLAAEDARKSDEIAAARRLQLSMLPATLPQVPGLETAAVMTTATEVGGDYYDFKTGADGSLLVALGDATGHGLAAGTMVTAVKAIFSALGVEAGLPEMLAECDRVLRGMNLRPLHMCLTLARIGPRGLAVCSAAMPPVLVHRAASGEVEEIGAPGLPLGAGLPACWEERRTPLAAGDTLLLATDGLPELRDPAGAELGFDGAAEAFRAAAGVAAVEVVERLMERVRAWRGDREPTDDLTLVAVRVSPPPP